MIERLTATEMAEASMGAGFADKAEATGIFQAWCVNERNELLWEQEFPNTVVTVGKNVALDAYLAGSAYTVTGPFMGLINNSGFSAIAAGDTMSSHAGWSEGTAYSGNRKTCAWSAASAGSKALSAALSFTINGGWVINGAFLVYGTGAVNTISDTNGTLYSAGSFTATQTVVNLNVVNVTYTASL